MNSDLVYGARRYHEPQVCPDCGKTVATLVPWHGDGSVARLVAHGPVKDRCPGSRTVPPGYTSWWRDSDSADTAQRAEIRDAAAEAKTEHAACQRKWADLSPERRRGTTFHPWEAHLRPDLARRQPADNAHTDGAS